MNLTFYEIIILIVIITLSLVAIKITFSFDFNEYLKRKDKKMEQKAKNLCPHERFVKIGDSIGIESTFVSPSGTLNYVCQQCGLVKLHIGDEEERIKEYLENPKKLEKELKIFQKHLKKWG